MSTTWKEFKESVEAQGIKDETPIEYIDWDGDELPNVDLIDPNSISII